MIYCPDCELTFDENDIEDTQIDSDGTPWCHCGCELQSIDPDMVSSRYQFEGDYVPGYRGA